jgi:glycosyltransferase involved in cell wall biosynthesis
MPARDEGELITIVLDELLDSVTSPCEVLVVVDSVTDPTADVVRAFGRTEPRVACLLNGYGRGPAAAIRFGIDSARAEVIVVTMADGSDDPRQIEELGSLVECGAVVAAASRYSPGGRRVGGPLLKGLLSFLAGTSLQALARPGTRDATNSYKAYSAPFVRSVGIESSRGFELGIELTAKARRLRLPVAEIPTTWQDRAGGRSSFRLAAWLPAYLRWYLFCFGRPLTIEQVATRRTSSTPLRASQLRARTGGVLGE